MYEGAVIDLDGTVYRGRELLPGADDAVADLRERGLDLLFLSERVIESLPWEAAGGGNCV
ncbi:MAG: hypothetical protein ABEJ06_00030, partial [Haloarculaceae archaeon]